VVTEGGVVPKRLVVCCDGTWNTPGSVEQWAAGAHQRHEARARGVVERRDRCRAARVYHRGVGTKRGERLRGGAFGFGLSRGVRDAYRFLVANFEPGDEIFFFGFSRGAFTARSAAGFVRNSGILRPEHADRVDEAYALYRSREAHPRGIEAQLFRRTYSNEPGQVMDV
jgi:uncharacterized protein (DUF2235 family)